MGGKQGEDSIIFSPFEMRGLKLKNRVAMAPMTRSRAGVERMANLLIAKYYAQRASAGLIVTEGVVVSTQAIGWLNTPGIYTDKQAEVWKPVIEAVHAAGAALFIQLWHTGRASHSTFHESDGLPVAPSAVKLNEEYIHTPQGKMPLETPRALTTDEIPGVVDDFRRAAQRAMSVGFDGVELHGANGYLIDEFLQSKTNKRTDQYGGSLENRFRFLDEIVKAVITVCPPERLAVHLSPNGIYNDMGSPDYRETFLYAGRQLDRYGLAYVHLVDGLAFGFHNLGTPMTLAEFREVYHGPLIGNCGYSKETAIEALEAGHADLISFGRPYISNPDLVERFKYDRPLAPIADVKWWYSFDEAGYTDWPRYEP